MSDMPDFAVVFTEGRTRGGFATGALAPVLVVFSGAAFLGGALISGARPAILCLADGLFSLEGLSTASGGLLGDNSDADATDMRDLEGRRSLDTGCDNSSLPVVDDRDGDLE